jgi:hypothetical protein
VVTYSRIFLPSFHVCSNAILEVRFGKETMQRYVKCPPSEVLRGYKAMLLLAHSLGLDEGKTNNCLAESINEMFIYDDSG